MAPSMDIEYGTLPKIKFVAVALPLLGTLGGILRMNGWSDTATVTLAVPLFVACFLISAVTGRSKAARQAEMTMEAEAWQQRDTRLQRRRELIVAEQQKALREIRLRQEAEQAQLLRGSGSPAQLAALMNRHRREYEELLEQQRLA